MDAPPRNGCPNPLTLAGLTFVRGGVQSSLLARRADPLTAQRQAYGAVWGMVQRHAAMLSFVDTFSAMAVVFLLVLPLLLIMRKPHHHRGGGAMH